MLERNRLKSEIALLEVIPPIDTRSAVPQQETMSIPHRWICLLQSRKTDRINSDFGLGTGVLIGPRHVLTAAHVLVSEKDPSQTVGDRLMVQPARNGNYEPFEAIGILGWQVHPKWIVKHGEKWNPQTQYDYGLVTLKKDVSKWKHGSFGGVGGGCKLLSYWGAQGIFGAGSKVGVTTSQVIGQEAQATGYPGDKRYGTLWTGMGRITLDPLKRIILHTIDTFGGQSGAPIWFMNNGVPCLAGIHSRPGVWSVDTHGRTTLTHNLAVLITPDVLRRLEAWRGTFAR